MVIIIRKQKIPVLMLFLVLFGAMVLLLAQNGLPATETAAFDVSETSLVYVIDAGHGGEDGGAVAADGTAESGINLAVALRLEYLMRFCGRETQMIRREDVSIHVPGLETFRERKRSDLYQRVEIVNGREPAVLLSIHQNSLPSVPSVHGAQVFFNNREGADLLAEEIQTALNQTVNTGNEKSTRKIPDSIYLMNHAAAPGVLVECGFLSNAAETQLLKTPPYQLKLAAAILSGTLNADIA